MMIEGRSEGESGGRHTADREVLTLHRGAENLRETSKAHCIINIQIQQ